MTTTTRASRGNFFEDFRTGQVIQHATPRTITEGDASVYTALTGDRRPIHCSAELARSLGYVRERLHDLLVFHMVFGKTVADISLNAVANLGYADVRFLRAVYPGDTLRAVSEVLGLRENSSGQSGIVWVKTRGLDPRDNEVLTFNRWVMVNKRGKEPTGHKDSPELPGSVPATELRMHPELETMMLGETAWAFGGRALWDDYQVGERIDHFDAMTIEEADHMSATRLYQNTARVHFDQHTMAQSRFGRRLMYGGHVISVAFSLAYNGLENGLAMLAWNGGQHVAPTFAGDTIYAWTEILDKQPIPHSDRVGALRCRLVAAKNVDPVKDAVQRRIKDEGGKEIYDPRIVLDLDYWLAIARKAPEEEI
jgi:2-methylfumaryl-CoA hydratase